VVGEQPQDMCRLGVGSQLVHRVGAEAKPVVVAEPWVCSSTQATLSTGMVW
jgi:hypothetical protein